MLQTTKNFQKLPPSTRYGNMGFERAKIIECKPKPNYHVWIKFDDGLNGDVDLSHLANQGIFKDVWKTEELFNQVRIHPETHTLTWGIGENEIDLDPYVLRDSLRKST